MRGGGGGGGRRGGFAPTTGEHNHTQVGKPEEAEGKDEPQEGGEEAQARPGKIKTPEVVHNAEAIL